MSLRNVIARIALDDARRFEVATAEMLRQVRGACADARTCAVIDEILREEEEHIACLDRALAELSPGTAPHSVSHDLPAAPGASVPSGSICERLNDIAEKEKASVAFYSLLAERCLIPSIRKVFKDIADQEGEHARKLEEHVKEICA